MVIPEPISSDSSFVFCLVLSRDTETPYRNESKVAKRPRVSSFLLFYLQCGKFPFNLILQPHFTIVRHLLMLPQDHLIPLLLLLAVIVFVCLVGRAEALDRKSLACARSYVLHLWGALEITVTAFCNV